VTITKRIAFGAAASWFGRGVSILLGLVLMPVLFRHLGSEELGVWLLLGQTWAALGILDLGLGFTLTRRIALARGKSGSDPGAPLNGETLREIADLVASARRIYRWIALGAFVLSCAAGFFYLRQLHLAALPLPVAWAAWGIICLSQAIGVWAAVWTCLLQGVGYIGWDALLASLTSALTLTLQIVVVLLGGGLVALAAVAAVGALAQRYLILGFARRRRPELFALRGQWNGPLVRSLISPALRAWLTSLGTVMVANSDQFLVAGLKGAAQIPAYRAAFVLVHNLTIAAVTLGLASGVFISHLWQAGEFHQVQRIVERNARLGLLIMVTGGAYLAVAGDVVFSVWLGPGHFIGYAVLLTFVLSELLEAQSSILATSSRATEDEAFAISALSAGVLKLALSWWMAARFGLLGLALGTLIALLLTNHWYMTWRGLHRLRFPVRRYLQNVVLPCGAACLLILTALFGVRTLVQPAAGVVQLASLGSVAALLFALGAWWLVLEPSQRTRLARALRFGRTQTGAALRKA
jgi:O-antigen/teichoic acid export membrane protein